MKRKAFTMLELVMVIVVLGILAALSLPRMEHDYRQEAADNILSAIRFAQHNALMDNVIEPTDTNWQSKFWRFGVRTCTGDDIFYYVGSDKNKGGNIDDVEAAIDPSNGARILGPTGSSCPDGNSVGASPNIFISYKHGIKNTNMFANCGGDADAARYIGFDYLGRPHMGFSNSSTPDFSTMLTSDCNITFEFHDTDIADLVITVEKDSGRAYIVGQENS